MPVLTTTGKLYDAFITQDNVIYLVGAEDEHGVVIISENYGVSWLKVSLDNIPPLSSIQIVSDDIAFATVKGNSNEPEPKLYRSTDGCHTWQPMIESSVDSGMSSLMFIGTDFGIVSGKGSKIFRYSVQ